MLLADFLERRDTAGKVVFALGHTRPVFAELFRASGWPNELSEPISQEGDGWDASGEVYPASTTG